MVQAAIRSGVSNSDQSLTDSPISMMHSAVASIGAIPQPVGIPGMLASQLIQSNLAGAFSMRQS